MGEKTAAVTASPPPPGDEAKTTVSHLWGHVDGPAAVGVSVPAWGQHHRPINSKPLTGKGS